MCACVCGGGGEGGGGGTGKRRLHEDLTKKLHIRKSVITAVMITTHWFVVFLQFSELCSNPTRVLECVCHWNARATMYIAWLRGSQNILGAKSSGVCVSLEC